MLNADVQEDTQFAFGLVREPTFVVYPCFPVFNLPMSSRLQQLARQQQFGKKATAEERDGLPPRECLLDDNVWPESERYRYYSFPGWFVQHDGLARADRKVCQERESISWDAGTDRFRQCYIPRSVVAGRAEMVSEANQ